MNIVYYLNVVQTGEAMFHTSLLIFASTSMAFADEEDQDRLDTPPIYIVARGAAAVPANANGDVLTGGFGLGVETDENNSLGLRIIYMDDPPDNPLASQTPDIPRAWGPVVDWQYYFQPRSTVSFYTNVSFGYVYGVPKDGVSDNVILPIIEGGLGIRLSKQNADGGRIFLSPELGFVPGAVAPYFAVTLGTVRPAR